uniref:Uncharacterized protein n=1 Tax=Tetranychus urticae TaxID=32264 RepID=T1KGD8_TETUR
MIIVENIFLTVIFWIVGIPVNSATVPRLFIFYNLFIYVISLTNCAFFLYQIIGLGDNNISLFIELTRSFTGLLQLILIHLNRSKWIQVYSNINQYINLEEIEIVKKSSNKFALLLIGLLAFEIYSWVQTGTVDELFRFFYGPLWSLNFESKLILLCVTMICRILVIHGVVYASVIFYLCSYYRLHLLYNKFHQKISTQASDNSVPKKQLKTITPVIEELPYYYHLFRIRIGWIRLSSIKRSLESSLNALPAVWFGRYLFESFLCLFRANRTIPSGNAVTLHYLVDKFTLFTNITILLIVLINLVDKITLTDLKLSNYIMDMSNESLDSAVYYSTTNVHKIRAIYESILIKSELLRVSYVPITIFHIIEIRRAFIPTYINTLIPMVVMALDFAENYSF